LEYSGLWKSAKDIKVSKRVDVCSCSALPLMAVDRFAFAYRGFWSSLPCASQPTSGESLGYRLGLLLFSAMAIFLGAMVSSCGGLALEA
jgi:hypothetical protein